MSNPHSNLFMKYLSLALLLLVTIYGIQYQSQNPQITSTFSVTKNELPIYSVDTRENVLALTFDSAWGTEDLNDILQILKSHNAPATFFVTGEFAKNHPEAILAIDHAGHEIANHGNTHKHMPQLSKKDMMKEIKDCEQTVYTITHKKMHLFRAPYSDWNDDVVDVAHILGYMSINHSVDSLDWKDYGASSIVKTVCEHQNLEQGSIILLHNGTTYTKDALDQMLTKLEQKGYSFVLVSDLIYYDHYSFDHTGKQFQK
ncbi:MAG: polysaccharide deacetylase family protein [Eubacteriales bacterium]|nr:polysaccharide deacetylase family protein [Eubacteriales bacterium]